MNNPFFDLNKPTPIQKVTFCTPNFGSSQFYIKRDDTIDKEISGNKWRKLKFNFTQFDSEKYRGIASFGGAYSNHIAALAAAGYRAGIPTVGFIRTHSIDNSNPTLRFAMEKGMKLIPLSRVEYAERRNRDFLSLLAERYPNLYWVPEGGTNELAKRGVAELAKEIIEQGNYDYIACAVGSGGTITGLLEAMPKQKFIAVAAVNDDEVSAPLQNKYENRLTIYQENTFGGYAKTNSELNQFCIEFHAQTDVLIEPIYTGKLMHALCYEDSLQQLVSHHSVLAIHTGGLQGLRGLSYRHPELASLAAFLVSD
jgi:1-aminocyclopropane-1-carboxylate deaminase